jgi:hypothetical protein
MSLAGNAAKAGSPSGTVPAVVDATDAADAVSTLNSTAGETAAAASTACSSAEAEAGNSTIRVPTAADVEEHRRCVRQRVTDSAATMPEQPPQIQVPSADRLGDWLFKVVNEHGWEYVACMLFRCCPRDQLQTLLQELCDTHNGFREMDSSRAFASDGVFIGNDEPPPSALLLSRSRPLSSDVQSPVLFKYKQCFACEPDDYGSSAKPCEATALLEALRESLAELDAEVKQAKEADPDGDHEQVHRAARYTMYRKYVSAAFSYLGHGVRVRIPLCVVEKIRASFPDSLGVSVSGLYFLPGLPVASGGGAMRLASDMGTQGTAAVRIGSDGYFGKLHM